MSIRLRVILIISVTNLLIILFSIFTGIQFVSRNIDEAQEADMQVVADIADRYISSEIELLHLRAEDIAASLAMTDQSRWNALLADAALKYPEFIGAAVFDIGLGRMAATGEKPAPADAMETTHIAQALQGKAKLGTTYFYDAGTVRDPADSSVNPEAKPEDTVFYAAVAFPFSQERLLAVTIPGLFFHDMLKEFQIWETGHVFMVDPDGTIISNPRAHWVYQRCNLIDFAKTDGRWTSLAETVELMARGDAAIGYYTVVDSSTDRDIPRVCAYKPVSGSQDGWSLGTVAPLLESPFRNVNRVLLIVGIIGFSLGVVAAVVASGFIRKPFEQVSALREEAEQTSKYKSQFLANMSHEMRTPLTSVIGLTELTLRTVQLDEETHLNLVKVYRAGETLLGLINDILDISKIEANKFDLNPVEFDLPSVLNDTITQSLLYVGEKPVKLVLDITEDLPRRLYGDELRIKQILNNLLSNAFKFTKEGTVELYVRCERDGDTVWLNARVTDTGTGIKPEDFDKLFTLYANMDKANKTYDSTRRIEGSGLGLSICKRISEMMDGSITVDSEYGKGSVFTVRLRQKYVDGDTIGKDVVESLKGFHYSIDKFKNAEKSRINLSYARVLVVDDNAANLDVAKGLMSLYGMRVDCVTGGKQAIDAISDESIKYDAVFMDHMMPGIDGIEATRLIREIDSDYAKNIPIIALTANAVIGNEEMFLSKGFQAFLAKPIELTRLDNVLRAWIRDKEKEAGLSDMWVTVGNKSTSGVSIIDIDIPGVDVEKGVAHFVSEEVYTDVLRSFARNTRSLLDSIEKADTEKLSEYAVTVHGIKGSSRGIFAEETGSRAEALENAANAGDRGFIASNHQAFLDSAYTLIDAIDSALGKTAADRPKKDSIDKELLDKFLEACNSLDIDEMDRLLAQMEKFEYTNDGGLAAWLRESLDKGQYKAIKEKLSGLEK